MPDAPKRAKKREAYYSGSLFKHTGAPTYDKRGHYVSGQHTFDRAVSVRRNPVGRGFQVYHPPLQDPKLSEIIKALEQVTTKEVKLGVLGTLSATPDNYDPNEYPPFERLYLARIKRTSSTLARFREVYNRYGEDWYQMRETLSDLMTFDWATLDTVYIEAHGS